MENRVLDLGAFQVNHCVLGKGDVQRVFRTLGFEWSGVLNINGRLKEKDIKPGRVKK
jgi:hypothetical protein